MKENKRYVISVRGKVQGVFFRKSTSEKAQELDLKGFVENKDDGSVYIEAEGAKENLEKLLEWSRTGPAAAKVDSIQHDVKSAEGYSDFEVKR